METRTTILLYGFILLTVLLLSTELSQNQSNPLISLDQTEQTTIPTQHEETPISKQSTLLTPTQHQHQHEAPHIELKNHRMGHKNKKKIDILKPFHRLLSTGNPLCLVLFKILKVSFRCTVTILYYPLFFLFNFLNHVIFWFWDQIIFPMTFPIRLACRIFIVMPIQLVKRILIKLKPVIVFLISGVTMGVCIGMMGSFAHLFIANRLFPIHLKPKKTSTTQQQRPVQRLELTRQKSAPVGRSNNLRTKYRQDEPIPQQSTIRKQHLSEENLVAKETKRKGRKKESESEGSSLEEADLVSTSDQDWALESHLTDTMESNKLGYSSAVQSIINDRTRKRYKESRSSSLQSILNDRTSPARHLPPMPSYSPLSPSNKKKVTFKTD